MKQEASKKSKLWLWLVIGIVALLAVVGVVLALVLGSGPKEEGPKGGRPELYWNVDKLAYTENSESGLSTREPGEDGVYRVRFAINGELVELPVADKQLINYIDTLDAMGLVQDADGVVVDVVDPKDIATEKAKNAYVKSADSTTLNANTSVAMNGMTIAIKLEAGITEIYDVTPQAEVPGQIIQVTDLAPMDTITVYANDLEQTTHIYVTAHSKQSKVYWRAEQNYNSKLKETARVPDENGAYSIDFFCDGERVTLKTKDKAIATKIDGTSRWKCHFGFTFDEEGYIIEQFASALGIGGIMVADGWDVVAIDGDYVTIQRLTTNDGSVWEGTVPADCVIYDPSYAAMSEGRQGKQVDSLTVGDRVTVWTDTNGTPMLIYIGNHIVDSPAYWVPTRKYSTANKETTREIGPSGYYEVELVPEGGPKQTYYIKDKETMSYLDSITYKCVGIKADANRVVEYVYHFECLTGYTCATQGGCVTTVTGSIFSKITIGKPDTTANLVLAANARVYNVSQYGEMGAATTIQPGDHVYGYRQPTGEILIAFVTRRQIGGEHLYWRLEAQYDSKKEVTTREPDADGWYYIDFAYMGKQVTLKTKNKDIVTSIDKLSIGATALDVSGDVILKVYDATYAYSGQKVASGYRYRNRTEEGLYHTVYTSDETKTVDFKMADDCVIYNVSPVFDEFQGERIYSIPYNAMLTVFCDIYGEAKVVYVRSQDVDDMYWKTEVLYDSSKKVTKREPDADGWYWYDLAVNGELKRFKTNDIKIASSMDSYNGGFGLNVKGDVIRAFVSSTSVKDVKGNGVNGYCVTAINGKTITLTYNKPGSSFGKTETIKLSSSTRIYDVSPSAEKFGAVSELKVGDTVRSYKSRDNETHSYVYIMARSTRKGGEVGYCEVCKKDVTWNPLLGSVTMTAADGHWYVTADMTSYIQQSHANKSKNYTICLDLNGHTLTRSANGRMFRIAEGETLNIMDSVGGGKVVTGGGTGFSGGMLLMSTGGTVNMYGGTLEGVDTEYKSGNGGIVNMSGETTVFNLYDGVITGGSSWARSVKSTGAGGNVYASSGAVFNMYGGTVKDGKAYGNGIVETSTDEEGKPVYKAAGAYGGNFYLSTGAKFNIYGGTVSGGEAVRESIDYVRVDGQKASIKNSAYGGNFYLSSTSGELYVGKATITGGVAYCGGNIYGRGNNTFEGATITDGVASLRGGNIYTSNETWTFDKDTKILNGKATSSGGNIADHGGTLNFKKVTVDGGVSGASGGNIYIYRNKADNVVNIYDGALIQNGTAKTSGGNINVSGLYTAENDEGIYEIQFDDDGNPYLPTLNIMGGKILNGNCDTNGTNSSPKGYGGNIYCAGNLNISGGVITGGMQRENPYDINFAAQKQKDENDNTFGYAKLTISGGEVGDKFHVTYCDQITISGAPKLGKINLLGNMITVGKMSSGAYVHLDTNNKVFTQKFDDAKAYADAGYFVAQDEGKVVYATANNELAYGHPADMVDGNTVYAKAKEMSFANADPETGKVTAVCPACSMEADWYPLEANAATSSMKLTGEHYYLSDSIDYTNNGGLYSITTEKRMCIHLNGQNLKAKERAFYTEKEDTVLTIMGDGTVTGMGLISGDVWRCVLDMTSELNLCGGTYISNNEAPAVGNRVTSHTKGVINVYEGTVIRSKAGGNALYAANKSGIVISGNAQIEGIVYDHNSAKGITVSGNPTIAELLLPQGRKLKVEELKAGTDITVNADGVFTKSFPKAKEYLEAGYFKPASLITVTDNNELFFNPVKAYCNHCGETVKWTKWTNSHKTEAEHLYIPEGGVKLDAQYTIKETADTVIDLRGQTLTGLEDKRVFLVYGNLSIQDSVGGGKVETYALLNADGYGTGGMFMIAKDTAVLNLYGGKLTMAEGHNPAVNGGILSATSSAIVNIYGGEICGGEASGKGQNIYIDNATLNIAGGVIDGGIYTSAAATISLSGDAQVAKTNDGLALKEGKLVTLGAMEDTAEIYISGEEGAFTEALPNAADYLGKIKSAKDTWTVENLEGVLNLVNPYKPNNIHTMAAAMDFTGADPSTGLVKAMCPVCAYNGDGAEKEWYPLDPAVEDKLTSTSTAEDNKYIKVVDGEHHHYYLSENVDYTQNVGFYYYGGGTKICLNLNGQDMTAACRAFYNETDGSVLNIMGQGTVSGNGNKTVRSGVLDMCRELNLYGGTYVSTDADSPVIVMRGSSAQCVLSIYEGTTVESKAGSAAIFLSSTSTTKYGAVKIYGGTINGKVYTDHATAPIEVSGKPVISNLDLTGGYKVTVGELTTGANITVTAEGVFTNELTDPAAVKGFFFEVNGKNIIEQGNALAVEPDKTVYEKAKEMTFPADGTPTTAICPHCNESVEWTALDVNRGTTSLALESGHYYLSASNDYTQNTYQYNLTGNKQACVHLNGQDIVSTNRVFYTETKGTVLTIMGDGNVTGGFYTLNATNLNLFGSTLDMAAGLNLYGGTYTSTNDKAPVVAVRGGNDQCIANIYDGVVIERTTDGVQGLNLFIADMATVNLYGGIIRNGTAVNNKYIDETLNHGGNVLLKVNAKSNNRNCALNVYGGQIIGGTATGKGSSIYAYGVTEKTGCGAAVNISGGVIEGGSVYATGAYASINLFGNPRVDYLDMVGSNPINVEALEEYADVKVVATENVAFTNAIAANADTYATYFHVDGEGKGVVVKDGKLMVTDICIHCGKANADVNWTELTLTSGGTHSESGHYYLNQDYSGFTSQKKVTGTDVVIDLRGHSISTSGRAFYVEGKNAKLSLMDTVGGAVIETTYVNGGGVLYAADGTLNVYGGTYTPKAQTSTGGCVYNLRGIVNIYGGTFNGTTVKADKMGGTIHTTGGTTTIYGGTINAGSANGLGDTIYVEKNTSAGKAGVLDIRGGEILGQILIKENANVKLSGAPTLEYVELETGVVAELGDLSVPVLVMAPNGTFAQGENVQAILDAGYILTLPDKQVTVDGDKLVMSDANP